jgi:tRNA-specific 2-thiouridylase
VVVGLSGGVDSSMALFLLKKQAWDCVGVNLELPKWQGEKPSAQAQVKKLCQELNVPCYFLDVKKEFEKKVVNYFINEYKNGRTPNPCLVCNPKLKFKKLMEFAQKKKIDVVATGHYARIKRLLDYKSIRVLEYQLLKAKDKTKDQTYYLSFLTQNHLKHIVFPLGDYTKKQVIKLAQKLLLTSHDPACPAGRRGSVIVKMKASQDFCYCPSKLVRQFLTEKLGQKPGEILDTQGKILGKHQGIHFFTLGQRKRIGLSSGPYFVKQLNPKINQVVVTKNEKDLYQKEILLSPFNFISGKIPKKPIKVMAKIRYGHQEQPATLYPPENNQLKPVFKKPQRAITPGQFAVFYSGKICLGGGKIIK